MFFSDTNGQIVIDNLRDGWYKVEGLEPGTTVKVREIKIVEGYVLDGTPQDILIKAGEAQQLTFWNKRAGTLVIQKKDSVTGALIPGAHFQLTYANGGYVDNDNGHLSSKGLYTTDDKGEIRISGITGTVVVKETKPAPGYVIDQSTQTQTVTVNPLDTQTLTFLNEPLCGLTLTKLGSVTGKPIPGTEFTVKDGNGTVLGRYTTGKDGTVTVTGLVPGSTVVVTETKVPDGYVLNSTPQTIIVKNGSSSVNSGTVGGITDGNTGGSTNVGGGTNGGNDLVFENDPIGTFELIKVVEENKEKRILNVTFEIRRASDDALVETVTTGSDGRVSLKLDAGDYYAVETEAAKGFKLDTTRHYFTMKNGKNTNRPDNNIQRRVLLCDFTL
ncbi:SpaA isopeptide-forming pilin-related protein [Oscillospiraceae bacterium 21-37]